jgi:ribosome maturation factor RimP
MTNHVARVAEWAEPIAQEEGCALVDVQLLSEGHGWILRVYVENRSGATGIEECIRISKRLSAVLDDKEVLPGAYHLEVSSPGSKRPVRKKEDFERFAGRTVSVRILAAPDHGTEVPAKRRVRGVIAGIDGEALILQVGPQAEALRIPLDQISKANLEA